jgi:hypothetical protein
MGIVLLEQQGSNEECHHSGNVNKQPEALPPWTVLPGHGLVEWIKHEGNAPCCSGKAGITLEGKVVNSQGNKSAVEKSLNADGKIGCHNAEAPAGK